MSRFEKQMRRRYWIMLGVIAVAVVAAGSAVAATKLESPGAQRKAIIDDAAGRLHVTPQALSSALKKALEDRIDAAVAAGRLTKQQGDELKARIASGTMPAIGGFGLGVGHVFGHGGPPGFPVEPPNGMFGRGPAGGMIEAGSKAVASYLGITQAQLRSALVSGKSLAQIAQAHGKTTDGLVAAIVAAAKTRLDKAVATGHLTSAQEQAILGKLDNVVKVLVTHSPQQMLQRGFGPAFRHRFWGPPGMMHRSLRPATDASVPQL
jgi:hypothetical protein